MNAHGPSWLATLLSAPAEAEIDLAHHRTVHSAPAPVLIPVELHLWGCTREDLRTARTYADLALSAHRWDIVEVVKSVGPPCPIPTGDTAALAQGSDYEWKWAAHRAERQKGL
jgi:hypothetical protein